MSIAIEREDNGECVLKKVLERESKRRTRRREDRQEVKRESERVREARQRNELNRKNKIQ